MSDADSFLRGIEALNRDDLEAMLNLACDDVEIVPRRAAVQGTVYGGAEGVRSFLADTQASFGFFELSHDDVRELDDDRVLAIGEVRVVGKASGAEGTEVSAGVAEYRDGRLARWEDYGDAERALAAAGLSS